MTGLARLRHLAHTDNPVAHWREAQAAVILCPWHERRVAAEYWQASVGGWLQAPHWAVLARMLHRVEGDLQWIAELAAVDVGAHAHFGEVLVEVVLNWLAQIGMHGILVRFEVAPIDYEDDWVGCAGRLLVGCDYTSNDLLYMPGSGAIMLDLWDGLTFEWWGPYAQSIWSNVLACVEVSP